MPQHVGAALLELLDAHPVLVEGVAVAAVDLGRHHCGYWPGGQSQLQRQVASETRPALQTVDDGPSMRQTCDCALFVIADCSLSSAGCH